MRVGHPSSFYYSVLGTRDIYRYYPIPLFVFAVLQLLAIVAFFTTVLEMGLRRGILLSLIFYAILIASLPASN